MDRKIKKNESNDKKIDCKIKDSGDSKKPNNSEGNIKAVYLERGDSGERKILQTNKKSENNIARTKSENKDPKSKYLIYGTDEKDFPRTTYDKSYSEIRKRIRDKYTFKLNVPVNKNDHLSLFKSKNGGTVTLNSDGVNRPVTIRVPSDPAENPIKPLSEETSTKNEKQTRPSSGQSDSDKKSEKDIIPANKPEKIPVKSEKDIIPANKPEKIPVKSEKDIIPANKPEKIPVKSEKVITRPAWRINSPKKRKPIIKTVVSKTDSARIFKAVTFVDNINSTPLEIKIPGEVTIIKKQQNVSKYTETSPLKTKLRANLPTVRTVKSKPSKETIKVEDPPSPLIVRKRSPSNHRRRRWGERRRVSKYRNKSPDLIEQVCPATEVARWVPASIDPQNRPYYEAWVDTTFAATSKHTKKDKYLLEYQTRLLQSFKRAMEERPPSPDLFYAKFADERYAGRIKIRQTDKRARA